MHRIVSFAGGSVRIEYSGQVASRIVDFLYRDVPADQTPGDQAVFELRGEGDSILLRKDGETRYSGTDGGAAADALLGDTIYQLTAQSRGGLMFHAAAVAWGERALLIPGRTGAGKTTLTAWILAQGPGYLTDELSFVPLGSTRVSTFRRPLRLKPSGLEVLRRTLKNNSLPSEVMITPEATLVPVPVPVDGVRGGDMALPRLGAAIFPRRRPGGRFRLEALSRGQTALGLTGCLINARNLPHDGFNDVARLAREIPGYRLTYGELDQLHDWLGRAKSLELAEIGQTVTPAGRPRAGARENLEPKFKLR